jgi:hypothetical protein
MKTTKRAMNNYLLIGICSLVIALTSCGEEEIEVPTDGRLTITGLDAYNGKMIFAKSGNLEAYGSNTNNSDLTHSGVFLNVGEKPAWISSDQAALKVYKRNSSNHWENYNGNDKYVRFAVAVVGTVYGFVTVDFTNGIASGVFVEDK